MKYSVTNKKDGTTRVMEARKKPAYNYPGLSIKRVRIKESIVGTTSNQRRKLAKGAK